MKNDHAPETPATHFLRQHGIAHSNHLYAYEEHGGTSVSARELNVDEHAVVGWRKRSKNVFLLLPASRIQG